jgi:uncharacterized lipoprotein YmbA
MMRRFSIGATALLLALLITACARSPRVSFYTLSSPANLQPPPAKVAGPAVAVGPVSIPEVVDRPQMVVRVAANRVEILETHRWAEPLKSEIPRLLARNLGRLLGSDRVYSYRENAGAQPEYRVVLDITRFESTPGEAVTVEAVWSIRHGAGEVARTGHSLVHEKMQGGGYESMVAAYDRALELVSADLAKAIAVQAAPVK